MVKNPQNLSKKLFLSLKYLIILTVKSKTKKKLFMFFSDFSHGITLMPVGNYQYLHNANVYDQLSWGGNMVRRVARLTVPYLSELF